MCLITFAWQYHEEYPLIVLANRDEFYKRPTATAEYWKDYPNILAGRDLEAGGTWMGVAKGGRWSALTNYRDLSNIIPDAPSRGALTTDFLKSYLSPKEYLSSVKQSQKNYNGYNLLVGDRHKLYYHNNINHEIIKITPGIYGLSNSLLNTSWPKVEHAKQKLKNALLSTDLDIPTLIDIMIDHDIAPDDQLPSTGVPYEWEKALSAMYITSPEYGTSITTVMQLHRSGRFDFVEQSHAVGGKRSVKKTYKLTF